MSVVDGTDRYYLAMINRSCLRERFVYKRFTTFLAFLITASAITLTADWAHAGSADAIDKAEKATKKSAKTIKPLTSHSLAQLLRWAARLTGRPVIDNLALPRLVSLSPLALRQQVCPGRPDACTTLVAAYWMGEQSILFRNTFDFRNARDRSYIVHELVHYLQHLENGDQVTQSCETILANERQAYVAQYKYLLKRGESFPIDEMMKLSYCSTPTTKLIR